METASYPAKGMCLDEQGNIVVLEPHYSRVNHFSPDGTLVDQWGERGTNRGQLGFPRAVAINLQGDVYVSEYGLAERVQRFSRQPRLVQWVLGMGGSEGVGFNRAEGLGLDPEGRLYVADSCHHRIQIFRAQGVWLRAYGRPGHGRGDLSYPYDVRVDAQGRQFVCEFGNSRIQIFHANDRVLEHLGGPGAAAAIGYTLPSAGHVRLSVYNVLGQRVRVLADDIQSPGRHRVVLDGRTLAAGVYFYALEFGDRMITKTLLLVK